MNQNEVEVRLKELKKASLNLDLTRGKPSPEQLDLASGLLTSVDKKTFLTPGGVDSRNYGLLDGLDEAKVLFSQYLGVGENEIIIGGNSSLALMYNTISQLMTHGSAHLGQPWQGKKTTFICPVPGYDRHFTICQRFGIEMVTVKMTEDGPDVAEIQKLIESDDSIRGMWCTPRYSNPTGYTCSPEVVKELASLTALSGEFLILWDDAYGVHHLGSGRAPLDSLPAACKKAGNPENVIVFGSTSKISFAGAGVAMAAGSEKTCLWLRERLFAQTIGHDKINMLRHVLFFRDMEGIMDHMARHAQILAPKFQAVEDILSKELGNTGLATWTKPEGGYFVSLDTQDGKAARVIEMAGEIGVKLTPAGSTFPYKKDPRDKNIRIAPTFPALKDLQIAVEVLALCIKAVS